MSHNIHFVRLGEFPEGDSPSLVLAACFENVPFLDRPVHTFNNVRVRTEYKHFTTDETLLSVFPSGWVEDESDLAHIRVGRSYYATIAMNVQGTWSAIEVIVTHKIWGTQYDLRNYPLPLGDLIAVTTLIGDQGRSVQPERFHLRIEADGTARVWHLPRLAST